MHLHEFRTDVTFSHEYQNQSLGLSINLLALVSFAANFRILFKDQIFIEKELEVHTLYLLLFPTIGIGKKDPSLNYLFKSKIHVFPKYHYIINLGTIEGFYFKSIPTDGIAIL